jgi:hypothetical protein
MAKRSRKSSRRSRKMRGGSMVTTGQRGGGWGFTGASSIPGVPGTVSNPQVFTGIGDCRATEPGYWIPQSSYGTYEKGLPGMSGGRRRKSKRASRRRRTMKQRGGRYTFDLSPPSVNGVAPNAAAWWAGTYPPVQRIACEGSTPNPLNPGPHTPSTQPTPVASSNLHLNPQSGGGTSPGTVGVGNVDSMYYYAPTAGYDNKPSTWVDSVGAPVQLQIPFAARELNPSCITTGHPPPLTGALQKGGSNATNPTNVPPQLTISVPPQTNNNNNNNNSGAIAPVTATNVAAPAAPAADPTKVGNHVGGSLWNSLKNSVKKATNAVGITRKNNSLTGNVGTAYNTLNAQRAANNARVAAIGNVYNNVRALNAVQPTMATNGIPPTVNNVTLATRAVNNLNELSNYPNSNTSSVYSNSNSLGYSTNSNGYVSGFEDSVSGGKRKRRSSKKSRKGRKGRKH